MSILQKYISLIILLCWVPFTSFSQKVKLGLPVGHTNSVISAAFSPDGKNVVTASWDKTSRLWDVTSGKLVLSFEGHTSLVNSATFSPDGKNIVTASYDKTSRLWDVESGKQLHVFEGHTDLVWSAGFSPDGKKIVTASWDKTIRIWDTFTGNLLVSLEGHTDIVTSAIFSSNGESVLSISGDNTARLWEASSGRPIHTLEGHTDIVTSAVFSPDGKKIITASKDKSIRLWDTFSGKILHVFEGHLSKVRSAIFSPDGESIFSASDDKTARIWDVSSRKLLYTLEGHADYITSAVFSPNGKTIITTSGDKTARLWDETSGKLLHIFKGHDDFLSSGGFSPDGKKIITTSRDKTARLWDITSGKLIHTFEGHTEWVNSSVFSPDGKIIITTSRFKKTLLWDIYSGKPMHTLEGHISSVNSAVFSPSGENVLTASNDKTARIWNTQSGELIHTLKGHEDVVRFASYSPDGNRVLTVSNDKTVCQWDVNSGFLIHEFKGDSSPVMFAAFNPDGKSIITSYANPIALQWDAFSGKLTHTFVGHKAFIFYSTFSPNGKKIITASGDRTARLWDASTGNLLQVLEGHSSFLNSAIFSPNGNSILTASDDNTARLWDTVSGNLLHTFEGHNSEVNSAVFSRDGKRIITASKDKTVRLWDASSGRLINILEGHTESISSAVFSPNGKKIITTSGDGSKYLWDGITGKQILNHLVFDSDPNKWVHLHPSGLFDASPEAMEMMYWTKGLEVIEFSQLKDRYWLPGLWEKVMKGEKLPDVRGMSELKLQPEVKLNSITDESVTIHLVKREGGYGKVSLFINGKEAIKDIRPSNMDYTLKEQTIKVSIKDHPYLLDGENKIIVKASSEDGFVQGRGSIGKAIVKKKELKQPQFYGVIIGVGDYANDQLNLKYTVNDAEAISKAMQLGAENLFDKDKTHIYTITTKGDELPTKENIKTIFEEISTKANAEDVITVYLSGHGITWGGNQGDFYFLTSDATATSNEAYNDAVIRAKNTISTSEWVDWLKEIPALKQVMIIDACGSGKAVDNLISERDIEPSQIKAIDRMKDRTGMYIISGCTADAVSYEASMYGQGLLTYSILQAFKGAALKEDKYVDIFTILEYARETVPDLAEGIGGIQEPQLLIPKGGSFDIGLLEDEDKIAIPLASPKTVYVRSTLVNAEEFEDTLGLTELLNQELIAVSSKGKNSPLVYFDAAKFPNACKVSGGYTITDNGISISMKLRCGKDLKSYNMNAATKEELIQEMVKKITN